MSKINILTISTSRLGMREGISTVILDYYAGFDKNKFELDIVTSEESHPDLIEKFKCIGVNTINLPPRKTQMMKYVFALFRLMVKKKYKILYIHGSSAIMAIELVIARMCGCKVRVVHSHSTACEHRKADKLLRPIFYASYTNALACGTLAGEWLFDNRKFEIVKNGRSVDKYAYNENVRKQMREQLSIPSDTLVVGHVGNFLKLKNQQYLVRVFSELLKQQKEARLYFMGKGSQEQEVKNLVKNLGLQDNVVFLGSVDNVPEMLQAMDVMVLPSLYEGLPLVVVEWQIAALPCLVSDTVTKECAYTDLVHFISLEENYKTWADKIIGLRELDRRSMMSEVKQLTRKNGYDLEKNVENLQSYFEMQCRVVGRK